MHDKYLYTFLICVGITKDIYQIVALTKKIETKQEEKKRICQLKFIIKTHTPK